MMNINIRLERPDEFYAVELLTRDAFWGYTSPTCDEHYLVHKLRNSDAFIPQLDFACEIDDELAGNVMYSKAQVISDDGQIHSVITFGPLSVSPKFRNSGVGSALMKHSILTAKELGYNGIVFHGHPDYYPRFGFQNAKVFNITNPNGDNYDALMAMELYDGALSGISGRFYEDSLFEITKEESDEYNTNFPPINPVKMVLIDVLFDKIPPTAQQSLREQDITILAWLTRFSGRFLLTLDGIDKDVLNIINDTLSEHGYPKKLFPCSDILEKAKHGVKVLDLCCGY